MSDNRYQWSWTWANALTLFRVIMVLPIFILVQQNSFAAILIALILFLIAAISDAFDGFVARKMGDESDFGAFFDPLADKILVLAVFMAFLFRPALNIPVWTFVVILLRDIAVTVLRSVSKRKKIRFKTSLLAKSKTVVQMVVIGIILFFLMMTLYYAEIKYRMPPMDQLDATYYQMVWDMASFKWGYRLVKLPRITMILTALYTLLSGVVYFLQYGRQAIERKKNEK